jgi:hypothetical protein
MFFDTENQLFSFFLNELNAKGRGTFISDRRSVDGSVLSIVNTGSDCGGNS